MIYGTEGQRVAIGSGRTAELRELSGVASVPCPAGEIAGSRHTFPAGSGVVVAWDVLGDPDSRREVCAECAVGLWH